MKTVIIVSKCLANFGDGTARFEFKGTFWGDPIKDIILNHEGKFNLVVGKEYLMYVNLKAVKDGILSGTILKAKELDDSWNAGVGKANDL